MHIDILDYEITIDGKPLRFPMSYEEVKFVMGEASRVPIDRYNDNTYADIFMRLEL